MRRRWKNPNPYGRAGKSWLGPRPRLTTMYIRISGMLVRIGGNAN